VPADRSGAGDPARTLELLWRDEGEAGRSRGPRPGLTVSRIVRSAIGVAQADGLAAVTMRRIATELQVSPMALYTYVPGKNELIDVMLDTVYLEMSRTPPAGPGWRERVAAIAHDNRALYVAHPWIAGIAVSRPPLGPGVMAKYESELAAFDGLGLSDVHRDAALTFVLGFVETWARADLAARAAVAGSAMTDAQWWAASGPLLARVLDPERYPLASRVGSAAGAAYDGATDPAYAYEFGLERVLDGLAALLPG
jgi:AcrR family transcriptional regulator